MGREANLEILLPYIEGALLNEAIDNYWFIDMTRKRSDHELIKKESKRLNNMFPGRVHLYNSEQRAKIIDDPDKIAEVSSDWSVFYSFLNRFGDNDIIAKCDDDTYFIDISTLRAAFDLRWENKKPYLMHANAINNGVCAYHQSQKGIWNHKEIKMYPPGGLSGPMFSHPEVACAHHKKFTSDMNSNPKNIDKYKLGKNIQFCNRVSINFIFMLGKDRHELSKIASQDEYDTSAKYPQREDRPNLIIGDFIMAHHTYGNQEPTMERLKTHVGYEKLRDKLKPATTEVEHQSICDEVNTTTTIKSKGVTLARAWVEKESFTIKDPNTGLYLAINTIEYPEFGRGKNGNIQEKRRMGRTDDIKQACVFNVDEKHNTIDLHNTSTCLKPTDTDKDKSLLFPQPKMTGQANYLEAKVNLQRTRGNKAKIVSKGHVLQPNVVSEGLYKNNPDAAIKQETFNFYMKNHDNFEWEIDSLQPFVNTVIPINIKRPNKKDFMKYVNDLTIATTPVPGIPDCITLKELIWMVKDYIWEFVPTNKDDTYHIKLIADDKPDMYLHYHKGKDQVITGAKQEWKFIDKKPKYLQHVQTGMYLDVQDGVVTMSKKMSELAMCPQK